jgi:hypothetical protein
MDEAPAHINKFDKFTTGTGLTVTVVNAVLLQPLALVPVTAYEVEEPGVTVMVPVTLPVGFQL